MAHGSPFLRLLILSAFVATATHAFALSELAPDESTPAQVTEDEDVQRTPLPAPEADDAEQPQGVPMPDPIRPPGATVTPPADDAEPADATPDADVERAADPARPVVEPDAPLPEIFYDFSKLPEPVQRMRNLILEATKSGEVEKLRPLLGTGPSATRLDFAEVKGDPVGYLIGSSGDGEGQEILAILEEVLEAGYVHLDAGTPNERYMWPYFSAMPLDKLTLPQRVELFRVVTAGDFDEMRGFGAYTFYRTAITPDGRWMFFLAGE